MEIISSKAGLKPFIEQALTAYQSSGVEAFIKAVHDTILKKKVRYPILEYAAQEFYSSIPDEKHLEIADKIIGLGENGSEVIAGKMLQLRIQEDFDGSIQKAAGYIIQGANWLSCDTLGERVLGHALLTMPGKTIPVLKKLSRHPDKWIVRSVGVATHYAVKKGLPKIHVDEMFRILLSLAGTTDFHTKKGVGWAAKTVAKFHPEIIRRYENVVNGNPEIKQWFRTKIKIGLGRAHKYAHRYTG